MCEYGFAENTDFVLVANKIATNNPNKNVRVAVEGADFNLNKNVKVQNEG